MPEHFTSESAQERADVCTPRSEWTLEDESGEAIIFDDTAVDCTVQWMQGGSEIQAPGRAADTLELEEAHMPSTSAQAQARQKRAREELRDKLIQARKPLLFTSAARCALLEDLQALI